MSNFKVGDVTFHEYADKRRSETLYTITAVRENGNVDVEWDGGSVDDYNPMHLRVIEQAKPEPAPVQHELRIPSPLPTDSDERKRYPLYRGLMAYFPAALAAVAHHSYKGNEKHNPGLPMQHARGKSSDHEDCILRHLMEGDYEGVAWRALALLQEKLEAEGAPVAPGATFPDGAK